MGFPLSRSRREVAEAAGQNTHYEESVEVSSSAAELYELVTDVARTGEWSPICRRCEWEADDAVATVGAWFVGFNEAEGEAWQTRSQVVVADPGREFAWLVGEGWVRWGYRIEPLNDGRSRLTESWHFTPAGITMFHHKYGSDAEGRITRRCQQAMQGIPVTLSAIKSVAETASG
jgi:hypothetical protein